MRVIYLVFVVCCFLAERNYARSLNKRQALNPCLNSPCLNGGACHFMGGSLLSCSCNPGYHGLFCESVNTAVTNPNIVIPTASISSCNPNPCKNGGFFMASSSPY